MQSTKNLIRSLHDLVDLIAKEAEQSPEFSRRLEEILFGLPLRDNKKPQRSAVARSGEQSPPDVLAAYKEKGDAEFRFWLRSFDLRVLKSIVKTNGFDPGKMSQRWTEPDKFVALIADQAAARLRRGSAFLPSKATDGQISSEPAGGKARDSEGHPASEIGTPSEQIESTLPVSGTPKQ